jgi:hypothetical protein
MCMLGRAPRLASLEGVGFVVPIPSDVAGDSGSWNTPPEINRSTCNGTSGRSFCLRAQTPQGNGGQHPMATSVASCPRASSLERRHTAPLRAHRQKKLARKRHPWATVATCLHRPPFDGGPPSSCSSPQPEASAWRAQAVTTTVASAIRPRRTERLRTALEGVTRECPTPGTAPRRGRPPTPRVAMAPRSPRAIAAARTPLFHAALPQPGTARASRSRRTGRAQTASTPPVI